jgi:hypothetical protein
MRLMTSERAALVATLAQDAPGIRGSPVWTGGWWTCTRSATQHSCWSWIMCRVPLPGPGLGSVHSGCGYVP